MEVGELVEIMLRNAAFENVINDPRSQFGLLQRPLLGPRFMPERLVPDNDFAEYGLKLRPLIANAASDTSPVQLKKSHKWKSQKFSLADSDIGAEFSGKDYDALVRMLRNAGVSSPASMEGMVQLINWFKASVSLPMAHFNEKERWECIVDAEITRTGDGNYEETIEYPNPSGARVAASLDWTNDANDPWTDISARLDWLEDQGKPCVAIVAPQSVLNVLRGNDKMRNRIGRISLAAGTIVGQPSARLSGAQLSDVFSQEDVPVPISYNARYNLPASSEYFLKRDVMVFFGATGTDAAIELGDDQDPILLQDTIGYVGVGTVSGESAPGKRTVVDVDHHKPPRVTCEGWQKALPIPADPDAISVLYDIDITP